MTKWEYLYKTVCGSISYELTELGKDGWEIIHAEFGTHTHDYESGGYKHGCKTVTVLMRRPIKTAKG